MGTDKFSLTRLVPLGDAKFRFKRTHRFHVLTTLFKMSIFAKNFVNKFITLLKQVNALVKK